MTENTALQPIAFPPEVLARVAPDLSLQRHLAIGLRPSLRGFEEFKPIEINDAKLSRYNKEGSSAESAVLGSSIVRSGDTKIICGITGGIIEQDMETNEKYNSIYPVIEISRGRFGAPTDEEMILAQKLYETVLSAGIISSDSLKVDAGIKDEHGNVIYDGKNSGDDDDFGLDMAPKRQWRFVLYAHIKVFSRQGPLFDLLWSSLVSALKTVRLPKAYIDERAADLKIPVRSRGNFGYIRDNYSLSCDSNESYALELNESEIGLSATFGIIEIDEEAQDTIDDDKMEDVEESKASAVLLADIEGEAEETSCVSRVSVIVGGEENVLKNVSIIGGGSVITKEFLRRSIQLARLRSKDVMASI